MMFPRVQKSASGENVCIVAEIGKNFIQSEDEKTIEEYRDNAIALIDAAAETGVDAVKFQTHEVEDEQLDIDVTSPHFTGSNRYNWVRRNTKATPPEFWKAIKEHCDRRGVLFFSTPMSRGAAQKLETYVDPPFWKVGSGDVQDYVLLNALLRTKKPIIISSGMVSREELDEVVRYIQRHEVDLGILYCISQYPCAPENFNLTTITELKEKYPSAVIGFSDHSIGHNAAIAAVKIGARIIEKHFSLSRDLWGSDHKVSMTPEEMKTMVQAIRNKEFKNSDVSPYLGTANEEFEGAKNLYRPYFNKKLVAGRDIAAGTLLTEEMVYAMRPAKEIGGIKSNLLSEVVGKEVAKNLKKYDPIASDSLQ